MTNGRMRGLVTTILGLVAVALSAQNNVTVNKGPKVDVRPGPDVLYTQGTSPLLENVGIWQAVPLMVSGASAYRAGEFLYQDYLYDESGAYPDDPGYSARNNADLVELRLKPTESGTAVRLTLNSMQDFAQIGVTIALGGVTTQPVTVPHGAGARMPADVFVTVHGSSGDIIKQGVAQPQVPKVSVDAKRRQVEVLVPHAVFDSRGKAVRIGAAVGLWDPAADAYRPQSAGAAFLNVAFRYAEPPGPGYPIAWGNVQQTAALKSGDLSPFFATVDFKKLAAKAGDDMSGQVGGVPVSGTLTRMYASRFEQQQGRGAPTRASGGGNPRVCRQPCDAVVELSGQLQPYSLSVPPGPSPAGGYALVYSLHGCGANYRPGAAPNRFDALVVYPEGRGACHWYWGLSAVDVFEAVGDVMRRYPVNHDQVFITGGSMGGYGTYRLSALWPDLFAVAAPSIGCTAAETGWTGPGAPPQSGDAAVIHNLAPSWRHIPISSSIGVYDTTCHTLSSRMLLSELERLGYRYEWRESLKAHAGPPGASGGFGAQGTAPDASPNPFIGREVTRNPARVTYIYSVKSDQRAFGLNTDHVYWLSGITARATTGPAPLGVIDVLSHGFGKGEPEVKPMERAFGLGYTVQRRDWTAAPDQPGADVLDLVATNISAVTVDVARARVSCNVALNVASDGPITVTLAGCK